MKFCAKCRDFYKDENIECPECGEQLGKPIRLAPKPGTPIVPRMPIDDETYEEWRKRAKFPKCSEKAKQE